MFPANNGKTGFVISKEGGKILFPAHFNSLKQTSRKTCHSRTIRGLLFQANYNSKCVLTSACKNRFELQNDIQLPALAGSSYQIENCIVHAINKKLKSLSKYETKLFVTILLNMTDVELVLNNFKGTRTC
uniref:Uncharacterized protein n=1 Tax=Glossina austeni TaxID=7395 RepID=A0A1A9UW86_GLOAU